MSYYQTFLKRNTGASNPGTFQVPLGAENCLLGLTFVVTGNFCEFGRDEILDYIKRYGGKITTAPSRRTSYVVTGDDAGPSKLEKIKEYGLHRLTEEELYGLVASLPAKNEEGHEVPASTPNTLLSSDSEESRLSKKPKPKLVHLSDDEVAEEQVGHSMATSQPPSMKKEPAAPLIQKKLQTRIILSDDEEVHGQQQKPAVISSTSMPATKATVHAANARPPQFDGPIDLWTTKYMPADVSQIIGNQGNITKLRQWLQEWTRKKKPLNRAVLISGPPGIGKTTAANVVAKVEGFKVLEYNASDTRSKKALHNSIQDLLNNRSMSEFPAHAKDKRKANLSKRAVIIMDEVDGMSAGDRGGMAELILLIKKTQLPIVCICNDRNSPKVRSLANYCLDLRFRRPDARQVFPRIAEICKKEGLSVSQNIVDQLVASTHGDIRQMLNMLAHWTITRSTMDYDQAKSLSILSQKDTEKGPFDIVAEFLSRGNFARHSVNELLELYFVDSSLVPLMIQENYLSCRPSLPKAVAQEEAELLSLDRFVEASNAIADADIVDKKIHGASQDWSLAPLHGFLSCLLPSYFCAGSMGGRIDFAGWLGQNSKTNKNHRLLTELAVHMCLHVSGGKGELRQTYLTPLISFLSQPLLDKGNEGVDQVIKILDAYTILKEDYDALLELGVGKCEGNAIQSRIPSNVKAALTRTYNKESHAIPYAIGNIKKQSATANSALGEDVIDLDGLDAEAGPEEDKATADAEADEDEDMAKDKMIKAKVKSAPKKPAAAKGSAALPARKRTLSKTGGNRRDSYDDDDGFVVDDEDEDDSYKPAKKAVKGKRK